MSTAGDIRVASRLPWEASHDKMLLEAVDHHGTAAWASVALTVQGWSEAMCRSAAQCGERYAQLSGAEAQKNPWTAEEDRKLVFQVLTLGLERQAPWGPVAQAMPGRSSVRCRERWEEYLAHTHAQARSHPPVVVVVPPKVVREPPAKKKKKKKKHVAQPAPTPAEAAAAAAAAAEAAGLASWTAEEEEALTSTVSGRTTAECDWEAVAAAVGTRTVEQCRRKWDSLTQAAAQAKRRGERKSRSKGRGTKRRASGASSAPRRPRRDGAGAGAGAGAGGGGAAAAAG